MANHINPYSPLHAIPGASPPLVVTLVTTPRREETVGGVVASSTRTEQYVCLSALPEELRQRVITAVQALQAGL